jgi:hypothetical protein
MHTQPKYREPKSMNWKHNFKILMDSVEDYARQWAKREEDLYTLSEWVKNVRSLIQISLYQAVYIMWFTHKNNIVWGLVGGDKYIFVMEERQVSSNIWVFKGWCRTSAHRPTECFNSNLYKRPAIYCWVCQMLHETSFQIINMYSNGGQIRASELLWH